MNCCYKGYIYEFLSLTKEEWLNKMITNYNILCNNVVEDLQVKAWEDCYDKLILSLEKYKEKKYYLIFEYELPHEGGRRPDLIILMKNDVVVIEFKKKSYFFLSDIDQVAAYSRDIRGYHKFSHNKRVTSILTATKAEGKFKLVGKVTVCSPDKLEEVIDFLDGESIDYEPDEWLNSQYEPLPTLVQAAKMIYQKEPLPYIKSANSAGIPEIIDILKNVSKKAKQNKERVLAMVNGVPGAGKTLLGLQFVYECFGDDINKKSVFLSGNGPLVEVLQHALNSKVFVQPLRNYIKYYGLQKRKVPKENIVVFDEAQRAWDLEHVKQRYNVNASEPDLIINIANNVPEWSLLLTLIGEGQEIHNGEEAGIVQWREAIKKSKSKWKIICPSEIAHNFKGIPGIEVVEINKLSLNVTLRSHRAEDVTTWINEVLKGNIQKAKELSQRIKYKDFKMYVTRNLDKAKSYCKDKYSNNLKKRYGLLASSKAKILTKYKVDNSFNTTKKLKLGPWFNYDPKHELSCCRMDKVVTEFQCQGLELDMPIVCWGEDMLWKENGWNEFKQRGCKAKDPNRLRINSYRVLLTRGRDGVIIYVPDDEVLNSVYNTLINAGVEILKPIM